jgi:Kef-type K+ transport system membrane component KefB/nucleotide-binding universal stress UspA family protein
MLAALIHNPLTLFVAQAVLVISLSRLVGILARKINQPMVIAEITAGILLGPSLFGWLAPGAAAALFPKSSIPTLSLFSQVGLLFFMFLIGLELDPKLLRGRGHTSVAISHSSIIVPFLLGSGLAYVIYPILSTPSVPFSSFTLFMGVSMSITAFPVLARILAERQLLRSKVGAVTITCAAVDDVTAWCILAFVVAIVKATALLDAAWTTGLAVLYILIMLKGVKPFLARLGARGSNRDGLSQDMVAVTFVLLLLSCWATEVIGIHALFGAFMMGAIIPKDGGFAQTLSEKIEDFVVVVLLPLFFAFSGLRTQIGLLNTPQSWLICAAIIFLACLGRFGGSAVVARLTGLSWRESAALGILMNTRGLMELIVLNIGLDLGVISPTVFTMMVLMALFTTFITTPLLNRVYPPEELAKELIDTVAPPPELRPADAFTLLMCVSYERSGPGMATLAAALGGRSRHATRLYALRLIKPTDRTSFYLREGADHAEPAALQPLLAKADELELQIRPLSFVSSDPGHDICDVAEVKKADLVLLGWHKPLLSQTILGGTVYEVMERARTDVGVLVERGLTSIRRVLVPYYGGPHDRAALALARRVLKQTGAAVTILHVVEPGRQQARRVGVQEQVNEVFRGQGPQPEEVELKVVEHPDPVEAALQEASAGYDLVMIGVGPEWGLEQRPFGLRPEQIIQRCPTSLLVVRRYEAGRGAERVGAGSSPHPSSMPVDKAHSSG